MCIRDRLTALSAREALGFMARLRLGRPGTTDSDRTNKVESTLKALGLQGCADTQVGTVEDRGISGGQRKRLSIAMELLDDPSILLLDEPTSGLDSKAAEDVIQILQQLSRGDGPQQGRLVLATIHQPSWALMERFDNLLLISAGRKVYDGRVTEFPAYFEEQGSLIPKNANPADHVMSVIQDDSADAPDWAGIWRTNAPEHKPLEPSLETPWANHSFAVSSTDQFKILLARNGLDYLKDKTQFSAQVGAKIFIGTMVGLCWLSASRPAECGAGLNPQKIFTVTGAMFMVINNCLMDDLFATVIAFPTQKAILMREYKNGVYGILPWFMAFWTSRLVSQIFFALLLMLPVYFLVGLRLDESGTKFFVAVSCLMLCSVTGTTLGLAVGACSKDIQGAIGLVMPTLVPMLLFSGYVIPFEEIPIAFKWVYWISPFQYAFNILRINQFKDLDFQDEWCKHECFRDETQAWCLEHPEKKTYFCTGNQYLSTLHLDIQPDHFLVRSFFLLGGLALAVFIGALVLIAHNTKKKSG
eukprot:TRINITY_DN6277_c0_g1_i2.p1 TRINITY_DN6277_c0_g1~~TRINITY_DN6277_c0_g1_i2.p1  ORF type:complete len:529 (-),score=121.40 TRINITY_DN6277_c0_g1_i2:77-1663(-)